MKKIVYVPVYIDGKEDNLPKEVGEYFVNVKNYGHDIYTWLNDDSNDYWLQTFEWWLKPVELPDDYDLMTTKSPHLETKSELFGFRVGATWMRDKILNQ